MLQDVALPILRRLARFAESVAEGDLETVARREFPFWNGRLDMAQGRRVVDFLIFDFRPRHVGRRTIEQFAAETSPGLDPPAKALLDGWVDAPRRLVRSAGWSGGYITCVDLLDDGAPPIDVFDIEDKWRPAEDEAFALRPLPVGDLYFCTGSPQGFGGRRYADVVDAVRRRHLDFVRTQRIASIGEFLRLDPKALDEESVVRSSSSILLPG